MVKPTSTPVVTVANNDAGEDAVYFGDELCCKQQTIYLSELIALVHSFIGADTPVTFRHANVANDEFPENTSGLIEKGGAQ